MKIVYVGPTIGFAQVALAQALKILHINSRTISRDFFMYAHV